MKNLMCVFVLSFFVAVGANAQCAKGAAAACCAKKGASSAAVSTDNATYASAEEAAKVNSDIMERVCATSGAKTYYQKSANAEGTVSWEEVSFCNESKKFKKVASASAVRSVEAANNAEAKAACCSKDSKANKAACSKDGADKACCSDKKGKKKSEKESN